jgi:hypothetical protein
MVTPYRVPVLEHFQWQVPVKTRSLSTPPVSPAPVKNDRYIVKATGSGDWAGYTNAIAYYDGSIWKFTVPTEGFACWVSDENLYYRFDGAIWGLFAVSSDVDARRYALLVGGGM